MRRLAIVIGVMGVLVASAGLVIADARGGYTVSVFLANAANLFEGGSVMQNGNRIGSIDSIDVERNGARITFELDDWAAPLHEGASVRVTWKAVLGERLLEVSDGPATNAEIPAGGALKGTMAAPVELDEVLAALDPDTRVRVNSLVTNLRGTLQDREPDLNATLRTSGPALQEVGAVLRGLGNDGEAIKQLVTHLNETMGILARREQDVRGVVHSLSETTNKLVAERQQIGESLRELPGTLRRANTTLGHVPGVVDEVAPLLDDLAPATDRLPAVAGNLRPLLADLRPTVASLRPTMSSISELLNYTPDLLDSGRATIPDVNDLLGDLSPVLDFLRPYTPELAGFMANWGSANANYDANGHYVRIYVQGGLENANVNPGVTGPGVAKKPDPKPGELAGQPWADAFGSGMR